jgi:DNA-binding MarR family transcriptional regulator
MLMLAPTEKANPLSTITSRLRRLLTGKNYLDTPAKRALSFIVESAAANKPAHQAAIEAFLQCSRMTAYTVVNQLVEQGMVTKTPDPNSGRRVLILPTERGKNAIQDMFSDLVTKLGNLIVDFYVTMKPQVHIADQQITDPTQFTKGVKQMLAMSKNFDIAKIPMELWDRINIIDSRSEDPTRWIFLHYAMGMSNAAFYNNTGKPVKFVFRALEKKLSDIVIRQWMESRSQNCALVFENTILLAGEKKTYQRVSIPLNNGNLMITASFFV